VASQSPLPKTLKNDITKGERIFKYTTTWPIILIVAQSNTINYICVFIYTIFKPDLKVLEFDKNASKQKP
jgi:hypothetical protein